MADHNQARVTLCERHAHHFGGDWWFQTYRGWAHTENGNVSVGRDLTERALATRRTNANAAHALAHAMFEDGSVIAGEAFIDGWLPLYERRGILFGHIHWHKALAALEQGDADRALSIYAEHLQPAVTAAVPLNVMTDCTSLLWRMHVSDQAVPHDLWQGIATYADMAFPQPGVTFADVHTAFAAAATADVARLDAHIAALDSRLTNGKLAAGSVVPILCRAIRAFADQDYSACVGFLDPIAANVTRIGGSHAQREVIEDMHLAALIKSGDTRRALALLDRRLHHRSSARDGYWRNTALRSDARAH